MDQAVCSASMAAYSKLRAFQANVAERPLYY
jgi:hypothetical protein